MTQPDFKYDVFISAAKDDLNQGKKLLEVLDRNGLRGYLFTENRVGEHFEKRVLDALASSDEDFVVLASAAACQSDWVKREHEIFSSYEAKDSNRKIFRLKIDRACPELLPGSILHADSIDKLVPEIVRYHVGQRRSECAELSGTVRQTQAQLDKREGEAFRHYLRSRFWRQLVSDDNVHIFTCGRDTPHEAAAARGGRTTIDKWDYKTVLDITHFLNEHYPATHVKIEEPVSKLRQPDLQEISALGRLADLQSLLRNKNCIIVGSPDVSDFAEIVLARTHNMKPYHAQRVKRTGYVIIKDDTGKASAPSSHYWTTRQGEVAGVAKLTSDGVESFPTVLDSTGGGHMHGILGVVANPFSDSRGPDKINHRIVLLSGFSGVATNGISKFLTDDRYLTEFGHFDREYTDLNANIEVLIGVEFSGEARGADGDNREIKAVSYKGLVAV